MIKEILKDNGLKVTDARMAILQEILNASNAITAEELFIIVNEKIKINLSTIYRNLKILNEKDIIKKVIEINGEVYFQYNSDEHEHHLICVNCKELIPLESCPLHDLEKQLSEETGYEIISHSLEFRGLCPKCKNKK